VLGLAALVASCIGITSVTGPTEVASGSVAEFVLELFADPARGTNLTPQLEPEDLWTAYLAVDVPEGWAFHSCEYQGEIGGVPIAGVGSLYEPTFPMPCDQTWPPVPDGFKRLWVQSQEHDTGFGGPASATVRLDVGRSPGQYTLAFRTANSAASFCLGEKYFTINVSDSLVFADNFELGTTSAWSAVVP
jgi:hypothetical protein